MLIRGVSQVAVRARRIHSVALAWLAMSIADQVQATLRGLNADFDVLTIDPDLADTAAFCQEYGYRLDESANAILIASKRPAGRYSVCLALATTRLDVNHQVRSLMDVKKLSFAPSEMTTEVTGMMIGGVTPFGLPDGLAIYVDAAIVDVPRVIVGGGDRATKIHVDPEVFERVPATTIVEGLASPVS